METLYCFKYDTETCEISKIKIQRYTVEQNKYTGRKTYKWSYPRINSVDMHYCLSEQKLDRYVSSKVFTFNPDVENVKQIIYSTLEERKDKAYEEYAKYQEMIHKINERGFRLDVK